MHYGCAGRARAQRRFRAASDNNTLYNIATMKSIIVGTDFSKGSLVALEIAIKIANTLQKDLILMYVKPPKGLIIQSNDEQIHLLAEQRLQEICEKYSPLMQAGTMHYEIAAGRVAAVIAEKARMEQSPMIVIGTNGASGYEKYFIGSTAVRIVQEAPCPTLTVREGYAYDGGMKKIVVPIRPASDNSRQKVPPAAKVAKIFDAEVNVLGLMEYQSDAAELRIHMNQVSKFLSEEGLRHTAVMKQSNDYCDTLMEYAESIKADMIVINTEQNKVISQFFLGTNAQKILHKSHIPVLCLHPEDIFGVAR